MGPPVSLQTTPELLFLEASLVTEELQLPVRWVGIGQQRLIDTVLPRIRFQGDRSLQLKELDAHVPEQRLLTSRVRLILP